MAAWKVDPGGPCFDQPFVLQASLRILSSSSALLSLSLPAACSDRRSLQNVVHELFTAPDAPPLQYADLSAWQDQSLSAPETAGARESWRRLDLESWLRLRLPQEMPVRSGEFLKAHRILPLDLAAGLAALARSAGTSVEKILFTAWQILLARLLGMGEVLVAAPFDGRTEEDLLDLPGLFARFLPVRVDVREEEPLSMALRRLEAALDEAARDQACFSWELWPEDPGPAPELPFGFEVRTLPGGFTAHGLTVSWLDLHAPIDRQAVLLVCRLDGGSLRTELEIPSGRLDLAGAERLLAQYQALLHSLVRDPGAPVGDLDLRSPEDLADLRRLNESCIDLSNDRCIHLRFAEQVARTPDRLAVSDEQTDLTYAELRDRVLRLSRLLQAQGVGPDVRVGICAGRSVHMVVALLAALEAGGAWVALDPDNPQERLAWLLEDARPAVLLVERSLADRLPAGRIPVLHLGSEPAALPPLAAAQPSLDHLAYACYTSGSTGRPKGVMISHRAIANRLLWMQRTFPLAEGDRVLQKTPISFDASVWEILSPLLAGAHLILARPGGHRDPAYLLDLMARRGITVLQVVPAQLGPLLQAGGIERCTPLRRVFCGGEALPEALAAELHARHAADLCNLYGPTETAIDALFWPCPRGEEGGRSTVPIGRPIANARAYLLSRRLTPLTVEAVAELFVGGAGLARGYLGRPDLTAERFLPDPFAPEPGARMYRTGDLTRLRLDGAVEFLGRADQQLKVRGFRIEPEEVEAALLAHPDVRAAVVGLREPGGDALAAWVVPAPGRQLSARDLRLWLQGLLPELMIPAAFACRDALPQTPGGKIDRRNLPPIEAAELASGQPVLPRSFTEQALAGLWAEILEVDRPGVRDHFFEQGGHSLLVIRLRARIAKVFGVDLPLRTVFEAPTLGELATALDAALRGGGGQTTPPLVPVPRDGEIPLSFAQQRLWFLGQLDPGSTTYNISLALNVRGPLDLPAFRAAGEALIARHETLRTTFPEVDGRPVQRIAPQAVTDVSLVDLGCLPEERRWPAAVDLAQQAAGLPFDLARGPLLRLLLIRRAPEACVLSLTMHHIVSDGWSTGVLLRDFATLYDAFANRRPPQLPALPVQYADFTVWQRAWLQGAVLEEQVAWWRGRLGTDPPPLELPTDRPRPPVPSLRGGVRPLVFPPELAEALERFGLQRGGTLFMTLLTGLGALLHRSTGQRTLLIGAPIANRSRVELEGLIGFFVNTLALPVEVDGDAGFGALLAAVRDLCLGAATHQDLPFEKLVEELQPRRDTGRPPLVQSMLALQMGTADPPTLSRLALTPVELKARTARLDLTVDLTRLRSGLWGGLEYSADLFDATTVDRLARHLLVLLESAVNDPDRPVADLAWLAEAERWQLGGEWSNASGAVAPPLLCLHEQLAAQAAAAPDAIALVWEGAQISYRELDRRANRVAHVLCEAGVGPETRVFLCAERSPGMVLGILGILKAGGAYIPLDPAYPRERLETLLADLPGALLLGQEPLRDRLPELGARPWLDLEAAARGEAAAPPAVSLCLENLAYVFYTSGSTGRPKGVEVSHGSLAPLLAASRSIFGFTGQDVWTLFHSYGFDFSVWEMWGALLSGGRLVLVPGPVSRSPEAWRELLLRERVTILNQTPAAFQALLRAAGEREGGPLLPAVRRVFLGGEALEPALLEPWFARRGTTAPEVVNLYGPTEATVCTTWRRFAGADATDSPGSRIGRVFPAVTGYVLGGRGQLVPIGVPGELYLGGSSPARGYLGRPDLTAERFVPDPFAATPGSRLYRTGDLVRYRTDGDLEYLGRIDRQIKIRGFRIEPGEIEAALLRHPAVQGAWVAARESAGGRRLVAWVRAAPGEAATPEALRSFLRERLPEPMIPAVFVPLASTPLTLQGKIDHRALPEPGAERPELERAFLAPRNAVEEVLAGLWADLLGIDRVGVEDDFFTLGGHSLLATQLLSRVEQLFHVRVPLRALFEEATVAGLSRRIAVAAPGEEAPARAGRTTAPLSFAQQRLWFLDQWEPGSPVYTIGTAFRVDGVIDPAVLARCAGEVVRRHEALRTVFAAVEGTPVQRVTPPPHPELPVVDLSGLEPEAREPELRSQTERCLAAPFDLSQGPLLRIVLPFLGPREGALILSTHHIVADGWSLGVLAREIVSLYGAFSRGEASPLPELAIQYGDFAVWQRERLQGERLAKLLAFWRECLAGAPAVLDLPTDRPRPSVLASRGAVAPAALAAEIAGPLRSLARSTGTTLFMTLLAGFAVLLGRSAGTGDLVIGTPVAHRDRPETEPLIGLFASTLALRVRLGGSPTFRQLLAHIREVALSAFEHQDLPLEKLVDELGLIREPSHTPLFQVVLALQNLPASELALPGLRFRPLPVSSGTAKFDLTLTLAENGDRLTGGLEYRTSLFDAETALRLLGHLGVLLARAGATPDDPVAGLPLLTDAERNELLGAWNGWESFTSLLPLHHRFAAQAALRPEAVAVTCDGASLTYGALEARANQLAHALRRAGAGPETVVGLCAGRSLDLVTGILGILKADGAYLPLDPEAPPERLAGLLAQAGARVLVAAEQVAGRVPADGLVEVPLNGAALAGEPTSAPEPRGTTGNLAYVLFTSGSTGRPKGVAVSHAQVARLFEAAREPVGFGEGDVWTLFHSFAFDFSVWEIWGALLHGGRLVVVPSDTVHTPELFLELLRREEVSILSQTPSAFLPLVHRAEPSQSPLPALRRVVFGGEALDPASLRPWIAAYGDARPRLINMYGITETTVHVTWHRIAAGEADRGAARIGRPLSDLQVHLLDPDLHLVPAGVTGEICIAGAGLARGYAGAPHLTAERFLPNPYSRTPGDRLYRSGDLARRLADGGLEFLGRLDAQVKVRGFRIEPAEIEAALRRHPAVRDAVAVAWKGGGEPRLVAYFTSGLEPAPAPEDLRACVQEVLPAFMTPAIFVPLAALPLTANGKIDRRALPDPGPVRPDLRTEYTAPANTTEEVLAQIWAQVLELDRAGVHDNFFVLGGDSILSLRVRALAQERGLRFSLPQLFAHQTVAELARAIHAGGGGLEEPEAPVAPFSLVSPADRSLLPPDIVDAYPLTAVQAGMLYHMAYLPTGIVYHNVYSYHLRARFDAAVFREAAVRVVDRHPILRTSFDLSAAGEPLQRVHRAAELPIEVHDWRALPPEEQSRRLDAFVEQEKHRGFDLSRPPLVRFGLHRRSDETFNLSFTECHPIFDGWSLHSFLGELFETYLALLDDRELPAAEPLRLSIADFVALERAALESPACRAFWDEKLAACPPSLLPGRRPGVAPEDKSGGVLATLPLPDALTAGLRSLARQAAVPLKSVLLTAHLEAMSAWSGERDLVTGLLCSGRPEGPDGDRILGLFFNAVPFRMTVPQGPWTERVQGVFAAERELLPHRRYPLAQLQKSRGGKPLFEVLFNYIHFHVLRRLFASGRVELLGDSLRWEENNLPLGVVFSQNPLTESLSLMLRHDPGQLRPAAVQRLLATYERILGAMAADEPGPGPWLSEAELHQALCEWNDTGRSAPPGLFLDRFAEQVRRTPEAPAVAWEGALMSYHELEAAANRLARFLRRLGVGPERRVGLHLRRSPDLFVALLGVLKAGGAYVPLDPLHPQERIAGLVAEARLTVLLTQESLALSLPEGGPPVLRLDGDRRLLALESGASPGWTVPPEAAAYILFTSGSTGAPKGVVVEHRQLASYLEGILERLPIPPAATFALVSTFAADLGNTAIFPALATGGCLHVIAEERCADAAALEEALACQPMDVLKIVPSHLAALLGSSLHPERLLPRSCLILGGETLEPSLVRMVHALESGCALLNHYGPTETTVGVATCRVDGAEAPPEETVPLGRPLAGTGLLVLDAQLLPVLPWSPGELCIAGSGLARGYLDRPDLTAERFVPHPAPRTPGERIYRTGDQARHLPDGRLEFLGRRDGQVKIRGFRIELREIEVSLGRHPAVRECAVVLHRDARGERQLAAFYTPAEGGAAEEAELRSFLRRTLPSYMLPMAFVQLAALPRNANGKIDRRALPDTGELFASWQARYVAPRSELERTVAAVWQEALQVPRIGMDDNFFDLGGHSLVMLRVHSLLRKALQRDFPMVTLFEHPTVGSLAKHLSQGEAPATLAGEALQRAEARHNALEQRRRAHISKEAE